MPSPEDPLLESISPVSLVLLPASALARRVTMGKLQLLGRTPPPYTSAVLLSAAVTLRDEKTG